MSTLLELLKQKKQDLAAGNRRKTIKPVEGTGRYRILPSWRGDNQPFWHDFGQHFIKKADKSIAAVYLCSDKTFGKPCEVCDAVAAGIASSPDDATMNLLTDAKSAGRVLVNALHLDGPTGMEVQILELAPGTFKLITDIAVEWEEAGESIFGKDILITRTGTGKNTKYAVQVAAKTTPIPAGLKPHNLDEYVAQESNEAKLRALNSVRAVSGLLPAPAAASAPSTLAKMATVDDDEDPYAAAPAPAKKATPAAAVEDAEVKPVRSAPAAAAPTPAPAAAAPAADLTGDDELDDLLKQLG